MRYPEVLLLAAEAHVRNNNDASGKGADYLNEVRIRAKLDPKSNITMEDVMLEKRLELCGESVRFQDMLRWDITDKMASQGTQTPWFGSNGTVRWSNYNTPEAAGFKERHKLLPFPQTELTLNNNVTQNPNW